MSVQKKIRDLERLLAKKVSKPSNIVSIGALRCFFLN
jgi:hypothetical protein